MAAEPLTVVQVVPALDEGGVERGTLEVAEHLAANGHRSIVVSAGGRLCDALQRSGSEHVPWPIGRKSISTLRFVPRLRRLLRDRRVDIVHARSRLPAWITYMALRGLPASQRPRFVTTVHGLYSVNPYSAIMTRGDRVIAVSETVRGYVLTNYPRIPPERLSLIERGIDTAEFPHGYQPSREWLDAWHASFPELAGKLVIVLPGRLRRLKGHEDFLRLLRRRQEIHPSIHGVIVGDDRSGSRYVAELKALARAERLPVSFVGHRADIREIYATSKLVLSLSSQPESFGRTVLEPLSLGVPVIGYAHGGVGEILDRMFPEGKVAVGDVEALIERTREFLRHPRAVRAENPYPLERMQRRTLALYRDVSEDRDSGAG